MSRFGTILFAGWLALAVQPALAWQEAPLSGTIRQTVATGGMVVSESSLASRMGADVLRQGGNAVDAAVATAFALAVTWPEAGNIGGGGFMMVDPAGGRNVVCIDYRETAPAAAHRTMFDRDDGRFTGKIVGVPGTVRGLALAHRRYGSRPWKELVEPAARLAHRGFPVDRFLARSINEVLQQDSVSRDARCRELRRVYGKPGGGAWQAGDTLVLSDLAQTLTLLAEQGPDAFYTGSIAAQIVAEMRRGGGLITGADLAGYQPRVREPIRGTFRGYEILGPPPPSSGGICLVQALNILEHFPLAESPRFSAENLHLIVEATRRVFRDRAAYLGDADFVEIPPHLTSKAYARKLADQIHLERATPSEDLAGNIRLTPESPSTTHFSVVDADGMTVANTYTLEASWGSRIVVAGGGFLLNNEMGDFNWFPGETTRQGQIGTKPNQIAPHKRMLSSQTPVLVRQNGRTILATGSPGGRTIISTVLQVVLGVTEFDQELGEAVAAPRIHHQWFPDQVFFEVTRDARFRSGLEALTRRGHRIVPRSPQGSAHSIWIDAERQRLVGVADFRRGGLAAGVGRAAGEP